MCIRDRITLSNTATGFWEYGAITNVSDLQVGQGTIVNGMLVLPTGTGSDFGDAPDTFGTLLASDGARHLDTGPTLGASRDAEADGQPTATADGDDADGTDDEDGVTFPAVLLAGDSSADVTVNASSAALLDAWADFNGDGTFSGASEQIFTSHALSSGDNNLTFLVPADAVAGDAFARFRLSTAGGLTPTGSAVDGEVEDYLVSIERAVDLSVSTSESIDPVIAGSGVENLTYVVTVSNSGPSAASGVGINEVLTLPSGVTLASFTESDGTYSGGLNGTWTVGDLASGANATLTLLLTADSSAAEGTDVVSSTATVLTVNESDTDAGNDSDTESTSIGRSVDLSVSTSESADPVIAGSGVENLTYVVTVSNSGPSAASGVGINEVLTLPSGVTLASFTESDGTYSGGLNGTWTVGDLASGANATLTLLLTADSSAAEGTDVVSSTATVLTVNESDTDAGNDSDTESTSIGRSVDLSVSTSESADPVIAGSGVENLSLIHI